MASTTVPTYTPSAANNVRALSTLALNGTATYTLDFSTVLQGWLHIVGTFGTVAGTSGLQLSVFRRYGSTPTTGESAWNTWTIPSTASTTKSLDIPVPTGYWSLVILNLDGTNALTNVGITSDTIAALTTTTS